MNTNKTFDALALAELRTTFVLSVLETFLDTITKELHKVFKTEPGDTEPGDTDEPRTFGDTDEPARFKKVFALLHEHHTFMVALWGVLHELQDGTVHPRIARVEAEARKVGPAGEGILKMLAALRDCADGMGEAAEELAKHYHEEPRH